MKKETSNKESTCNEINKCITCNGDGLLCKTQFLSTDYYKVECVNGHDYGNWVKTEEKAVKEWNEMEAEPIMFLRCINSIYSTDKVERLLFTKGDFYAVYGYEKKRFSNHFRVYDNRRKLHILYDDNITGEMKNFELCLKP